MDMNVTTNDYMRSINDLFREVEDCVFLTLFEATLLSAKRIAQDKLDRALFEALDWPERWGDYQDYLRAFVRWAPDQTDNPAWKDPKTGSAQEVYDRLCHFYWLINQPFVLNGKETTWQEEFPAYYTKISNDWGAFLNTEDSWSKEQLENFTNNSPQYRVQDYKNPESWKSFNEFFSREIKDGLRPVHEPDNNLAPTFPADCTFRKSFPISTTGTIPGITIKNTHRFATIRELLHCHDNHDYADRFNSGLFAHYFLSPFSYHRFHIPVSGRIVDVRKVHGQAYLDVTLQNGQFDAPDNAQGGYEFTQARGVITIDTSGSAHGDIGYVTVIPIGMAQCSSVHMYESLYHQDCKKGDEFGFFQFGGSDIIILFEEKAKAVLQSTGDKYNHYGQMIAKCS
ncbi:phosphatidylserine decarboxylase [Kiloniella sp. b19]|uniref:phosphatidylserine decarboxylase n=1 Tax=Kiloniella sp. GXU_MW_B19 TaxID=3141326 RepID=UPI0031D3A8FF